MIAQHPVMDEGVPPRVGSKSLLSHRDAERGVFSPD